MCKSAARKREREEKRVERLSESTVRKVDEGSGRWRERKVRVEFGRGRCR